MKKFLLCYPFSNPKVRLVEGFSVYDGVLGDQIDAPHKGIDYVLNSGKSFESFAIHAMHDGQAFQGTSDSWGTFVLIQTVSIEGIVLSTIYAHLSSVQTPIAPQFIELNGKRIQNPQGTLVHAGLILGQSGTTGWTNGINQLHIEVHVNDDVTNEMSKLDPYGLNDRASSNRYPQPGSSLAGLDHAWLQDFPPFAK